MHISYGLGQNANILLDSYELYLLELDFVVVSSVELFSAPFAFVSVHIFFYAPQFYGHLAQPVQ